MGLLWRQVAQRRLCDREAAATSLQTGMGVEGIYPLHPGIDNLIVNQIEPFLDGVCQDSNILNPVGWVKV